MAEGGPGPGLDEFALIAKLFAPLTEGDPGAFGLLDDAAIIPPHPEHDLVVKTDGLVAGVHFFADDPPALIAKKLLRVNLSDLAAKGAEPYGYVLTPAFPRSVTLAWLEAFVAGLAEDQAAFGIHLLGGDTMATPGPLTLSLTALGHVPRGAMIRRKGARPGDGLFVTGTIGDAVLGLAALKGEALGLDEAERAFCVDRFRCPQPRLGLRPALRQGAHAALDVSDGLIADLGHLTAVSEVRAVLDLAAVPLSSAAGRWAGQSDARRLRLVTGGDDYEVLLAAPPEAEAALLEAAWGSGIRLTRIGLIEQGRGDVIKGLGGAVLNAGAGGYRHF